MKVVSTLIVCLYGLFILCAAFRIDITPDVYTEETPGPVNITCQLESSDAANADIILLQILNDAGQPVVFLRKGEILSFGNGYSNSSKFQADGIINLLDSFLRLSIVEPKRTDAGLYTCKMFFSDSAQSLEERKASGNLIMEKMDIIEVVRQLNQRISTLKKELEAQNTKDHDMAAMINQLKVSNDKLQDKDDEIAKELSQLKARDQELEEKVTYICAFSAGFVTQVIAKDTVIIFTNVHTNHGAAYDKTTGVFTAPRDGVYAFNLVMMARMNATYCCYGHVDLLVNDAEIGWLRVDTGRKSYNTETSSLTYELQSSVNQVVSLTKGDKVKARTYGKTLDWRGGHFSHFSGFFIKAF